MTTVADGQREAIRPWAIQASTVIAARLHDARAHAEAGRMHDAADRLDELDRSLRDNVLGPARAQFYYAAFHDQKSVLDRDIVDYTVQPTPLGAIAAKTSIIAGRDQYRAIGHLIDTAGDELKLAGSIQRPDAKTRSAFYEGWERRHRSTITGATHGALSDAQMALHNAIGQLLIRPEIR